MRSYEDFGFLVEMNREDNLTLSSELAMWVEFYRTKAHIIRRGNEIWPAHKILLQLAAEFSDDTPITQSVDKWLSQGKCDWIWLRDLHRPNHYQSDACLVVLEGHTNSINGVKVLEDGRVLSWSSDRTLRLWDGNNGASLAVLDGHTAAIKGVKVLDDGRILSWSRDVNLRLWDGQSGASLAVLKCKGRVRGAQILSDGRILTWSEDRILRLLDAHSGEPLAEFKGHTALIIGAKFLVNNRILSWSRDKTLRVWDGQSGASLSVLEGHTSEIKDVEVFKDGRILSWSK